MSNPSSEAPKILQWNIRGVRHNRNGIEKIVSEFNPLVIALNETKVKEKDTFRLKDYKIFRKELTLNPNDTAHGGLMTCNKEDIKAETIPLITEFLALAIKVDFPFPHIICNIYLNRNDDVTKENLIELIEQLGNKFILIGDFNAHNISWGSKRTDARGRKIEEVCDTKVLTIINDNSPTYVHFASNQMTNIDLSITTPNLTDELEWRTLDDL